MKRGSALDLEGNDDVDDARCGRSHRCVFSRIPDAVGVLPLKQGGRDYPGRQGARARAPCQCHAETQARRYWRNRARRRVGRFHRRRSRSLRLKNSSTSSIGESR
jgi:hypothetical protein